MDETAHDPQPEEPAPGPLTCPGCGLSIDPATVSGPVIECPQCNTQFFAPVSQDADEQREVEEHKASLEEELSALRIKQLSTLRRTAYRTRSYLIVGTVGCAWLTIPVTLNILSLLHEQHRWGLWATTDALLGIAAILGAYEFGKRVVDVQRAIVADLRARELEELEAARHEPDLSLLSDGSQHAKALEQLAGGTSEESSTQDTNGDAQ